MGFIDNLSTNIRLTGASFRLIFQYPIVLVLPLLTLIWVGALIVVPVTILINLATNDLEAFGEFLQTLYFVTANAVEQGNFELAITSAVIESYILWAVWMTVVFTGSLFFITAGMDVATQQIKSQGGHPPRLGRAFATAGRNLGRLFLMALLSAAVIVWVRYLTRIVTAPFAVLPFARRAINRAVQTVLTMLMFLLLPALVYERDGFKNTLNKTWLSVKKTGAGVVLGGGLLFGGMWLLLNTVASFILKATLQAGGIGDGAWAINAVIAAVTAALGFAIASSVSAAQRATLYWYATEGLVPAGFNAADLPTIQLTTQRTATPGTVEFRSLS